MISVDYEQVVYAGNGSQDAWPYSFPIYDGDVIRLILIDTDGTEINIEQDYFVDVPGSTVYYPGYAPGEEPPVADQPPKVQSGQKLIVYRDTEITQDSDLGDSWPFNVIEKALDKLTMILQEKAFALARCLKISQGQAAEIDNYNPTVPLEAGKVICGNAAGDGFEAREALMEVNGAWDGEGRQIHSVADPTAAQDAVTKKYADNRMDNNFMKLQPDGTAWEARNLPIGNVAGPALVRDAANKDYVDRILAGYSGQGERFVFFDNVAQMKAAELVPSQVAVTLGYYDVNDGGAGVYAIRDVGADTPDEGSLIAITGTSYVAELITDGTVNVKQFGAKGDGSEDDTQAIQKAMNCLKDNYCLYFPCGTYIVTPTAYNLYVLSLPNVDSLVVKGDGIASVIKIKASSGEYRGIIGYVSGSTPDGLTVCDIAFDHNAQNNVQSEYVDKSGKLRLTISNYSMAANLDNVVIDNVTVYNCDSVVSLYFPNVFDGGSVIIRNCAWIDARNGNGTDFDQSFINATTNHMEVTNCIFRGASWTLAPRTAIETHASNCIVANNRIDKFQVGANITGISEMGTTYRQICSNNTFNVSWSGVKVYSQKVAGAATTVGYEEMVISDNVISVDPNNYPADYGVAAGFPGISMYGGSLDVDFKNLTIRNNLIKYPLDAVGDSYFDRSISKYWGGISAYFGAVQDKVQESVLITGNTVYNCAASGIYLDYGIWEDLTISNNILCNCGTVKSSNIFAGNKVPLYVTVAIQSDATISDNTIIDNSSTTSITDFIWVRDESTPQTYKYEITDNIFKLNASADISSITDYVEIYRGTKVFFKGLIPLSSIRMPLINGGVGSFANETDTGDVIFKTGSTVSSWRRTTYGTAIPNSGYWRNGEICINTSPSAGGYVGWVCVTDGEPGTWKGFGEIEA